MNKILVVSRKEQGERLDKFLSRHMDFISRTKIHRLIEKEKVYVNGRIRRPSARLKEKDEIKLSLEEEKKDLLKPFEFTIKIIYEDADIIVVEKPAGLVVHPPQEGYDKTLVNALVYMKKELSTISPLRKGVVHRLDKETSGVMVLAKHNQCHLNLIEQFKQRKVKKEYRAICWGTIKKERLVVDLPLTRDKRNRLKMKVSFVKSRQAFTDILVLERFKDSTYLSLNPLTGRTHQLRVHLKFLGHPIVGDKKYGIKDDYDGLFLHAYKLGFYHPKTAEFREFSSPLPEKFKEFIRERKCLQ